MTNLPKRDDYKEIESFADYELTQCVAYEMMVRNDDFIKDWYELVSNSQAVIQKDKKIYANSECSEEEDNLFFDALIEKSKKWGININEFCNAYDYEAYFLDSHNFFKIDGAYKDAYEITDLQKDITNHYDLAFCRPKIQLKNISKVTLLEINLSLPKNELIAIISKIKDEADLSNIQTPLEFLGETLEDATAQKDYPKKPTAEKMADMFFIYDYVKARLNNIEKENKLNDDNLKIEIEDIKKFHTGKDRKIRISYAKAEFLESIINTKIEDIFKEDELTKVVKNVSKLYYAIRPYIEDLKYKELVTGVSAI